MDESRLVPPYIYLDLVRELNFDPLPWSPVISSDPESTVQIKRDAVTESFDERTG